MRSRRNVDALVAQQHQDGAEVDLVPGVAELGVPGFACCHFFPELLPFSPGWLRKKH